MLQRADDARNNAKITKAFMENPLATQRELAEEAGVSVATVNTKLNKIKQEGTKDDRIVGLTDGDFDLMKLIQKEKFRRLEQAETINHNDLDKWENTAVKRYTLFRGSATDESGGLKQIENIVIE